MGNEQKMFLFCCMIIILFAIKGLAMKRDFTYQYQNDDFGLGDADTQANPALRESGGLSKKLRNCVNQMNTCFGIHFGSSYDEFGYSNHFSQSRPGFELFAKNLFLHLKESFLDSVQHADGIKWLHKSCRRFDEFAQCCRDVSKSTKKEHCPELEHVIVFLQGVSDYICEEDLIRYHKHFANSGCIDDIKTKFSQKCLYKSGLSKFADSVLPINLIVTLAKSASHRETILKHFVCQTSTFVSCIESEIQGTCPKTADILITMFNKGIENVFETLCSRNFIPSPKSCARVKTQFLSLIMTYVNKISDIIQENAQMDCSDDAGFIQKLPTCLKKYGYAYGLYLEDKDLGKLMNRMCKENIVDSMELCLSQYQAKCIKPPEIGVIFLNFLKDTCELASSLQQSPCSWADMANVEREWHTIQKQRCGLNFDEIMKGIMWKSQGIMKDDEPFRCCFDAAQSAGEVVLGKKCPQFLMAYVRFLRKFHQHINQFRCTLEL